MVAMLRVLIVEDDAAREERLRELLPEDFRGVVARSAGAALGILRRDRGSVFKAILLDHDLQQRAVTEADRALSGSQVVELIIAQVSPDVPVLVHSMNPAKAAAMARRLEVAGFWVTRIPMAELRQMDPTSKNRLTDWIAEVRETWEE